MPAQAKARNTAVDAKEAAIDRLKEIAIKHEANSHELGTLADTLTEMPDLSDYQRTVVRHFVDKLHKAQATVDGDLAKTLDRMRTLQRNLESVPGWATAPAMQTIADTAASFHAELNGGSGLNGHEAWDRVVPR